MFVHSHPLTLRKAFFSPLLSSHPIRPSSLVWLQTPHPLHKLYWFHWPGRKLTFLIHTSSFHFSCSTLPSTFLSSHHPHHKSTLMLSPVPRLRMRPLPLLVFPFLLFVNGKAIVKFLQALTSKTPQILCVPQIRCFPFLSMPPIVCIFQCLCVSVFEHQSVCVYPSDNVPKCQYVLASVCPNVFMP